MLRLERGVLFHQVNCQGVMGGGIAASLARKFPGLEKAYQDFIENVLRTTDKEIIDHYRTEHGDILCETDFRTALLLGKVFVYKVTEELYIVNVFGQGDTSSFYRNTSYDATVNAFEEVSRPKYFYLAHLPFCFPYGMGCGLGGGNWQIYATIIEAYFPHAIICKYTP